MAQRKNALKLVQQEARLWTPADHASPETFRWIEFTVKSTFAGEPVSIRCSGFRLSRDTYFDKRGRLVDAACVESWRPFGVFDTVLPSDRLMAQMLMSAKQESLGGGDE